DLVLQNRKHHVDLLLYSMPVVHNSLANLHLSISFLKGAMMLEDPRRVRTREALRRALLGLLEDESLASISIAALCEAAGVHRTTFYKHASSIEEFAADVITRELDAIATIDTGA